MEEFNSCLDTCGLLEVAFQGHNLSWCNGQGGRSRRWMRLDRAMSNMAFNNYFVNTKLEYLLRKTYDHCPMVISLDSEFVSYGSTPFQF